MSAATKLMLAPAGSTGTPVGTTVDAGAPSGAVAFQLVTEAVGATPTMTAKFQGSLDGANWYDLAYVTDSSDTSAVTAITRTTVGASLVFLDSANSSRNYTKYRVNVSANTNCTFRAELYVFSETDI